MRLPRPGDLLIALPELQDPQFMRSLVYLLEANDSGAMGLIINRPLEMHLGALWDECPQELHERRCCASGGPVEMHKGLLLHPFASISDSYDLGDGVAIGGDPEQLKARLSNATSTPGPRLFLGHAGWELAQLHEEMRHGSWLVRRGHPHLLLDPEPDDDLWESLLRAGPEADPPSLN